MLSSSLLRYEFRGGLLEPAWIDARYAGLIRALAVRYEAFSGKPYRDLDRALRELPEAEGHEAKLVAGLRQVLEESLELVVDAPGDPRKIREAVFEAAAGTDGADAPAAYRRAAERLGLGAIEPRHLHADLGGERVARFPRPIPPPGEIIGRYNFRLVQGLLARAAKVLIETDGEARAIYRAAKLHGLLVEVRDGGRSGFPLSLEITGPLSLFRLTRKYGRALAGFLPACAAANRFRLTAKVSVRPGWARLVVTSADRLLSPHRPPRMFDSKLEERFLKDFVALGSPWEIRREEQVIPLGPGAFLPDFTFRRADAPGLRIDLEIVGFWTRDYLARKRDLIARLPDRRIIFCIDEKLRCGEEERSFPCIPFKRRVPAGKVLEALEEIRREDGFGC